MALFLGGLVSIYGLLVLMSVGVGYSNKTTEPAAAAFCEDHPTNKSK